jgi:ArsR family metal-binding transcriptional regulator
MESEKDYVKQIQITEIAPCFTKPGRIRVEARTVPEGGEPLLDLLPIILLKYPPSVVKMDERDPMLNLRMYDRTIGIFPSGVIGMQNTRDEAEAGRILEEIRRMLNEAYRDLVKNGRPSPERIEKRLRLNRISTFKIMKCLPNKTHCHRCGEPSCSAFALKLRSGQAAVNDCEPLTDVEFQDKREELLNLIGGMT